MILLKDMSGCLLLKRDCKYSGGVALEDQLKMTGAFVIKGHKTLFGVGEDRNGFKLILVVPQD